MRYSHITNKVARRFLAASPPVINVRGWIKALKEVTGADWKAIQYEKGPAPHMPGFVSASNTDFSSVAGNLNLTVWKHESGSLHPILWWRVKTPGGQFVEGSHVPLQKKAVRPNDLTDPYSLTPYIKDPTYKQLFGKRPTQHAPKKDLATIIQAYFKPRIWNFALQKDTDKRWNFSIHPIPPKNDPTEKALQFKFDSSPDRFSAIVRMNPQNPAFALVRLTWDVGKHRGSEEAHVPLEALVGPNRMRRFFKNDSYLRTLFSKSIEARIIEAFVLRQAVVNPADKIRNFFGIRNWQQALNRLTRSNWKHTERKVRSILGYGLIFNFEDGAGNELSIFLNHDPSRNRGIRIHSLRWDIFGIRGGFGPPEAYKVPEEDLASPQRIAPYVKDTNFKAMFGKKEPTEEMIRRWQAEGEEALFNRYAKGLG